MVQQPAMIISPQVGHICISISLLGARHAMLGEELMDLEQGDP
jgi:hypothetical protein